MDAQRRAQADMQEVLNPDKDDMFNAIQIPVTNKKAKHFKNLDFGFNRDASYSTYHWGILPFMVIPVLLAQASQQWWAAE